MGRNNRQRRAAKQSAAKRRQSHLRPGGAPAGSGPTDTPFPRRNDRPFARPEAAPSVERLRREQAERSLSRLLGARASAQRLVHIVEQELISLQSEGLQKLDEVVTARLRYVVAALWEHGWQPPTCFMSYTSRARG